MLSAIIAQWYVNMAFSDLVIVNGPLMSHHISGLWESLLTKRTAIIEWLRIINNHNLVINVQ